MKNISEEPLQTQYDVESSSMLAPISQSIKVFLSYSPADANLCAEFEKHLAILKRQSIIDTWNATMVAPGADWRQEIKAQIERANLLLLLISPDFLASDHLYNSEMRAALLRHERGESIVVPIILRHVDWTRAPFAHLQVLPPGGIPVVGHEPLDAGFVAVARGIRQLIEAFHRQLNSNRTESTPIVGDAHQMERLRAHCEARARGDISRFAGKKYIPALYVQRQRQHSIAGFLENDDVLSARINAHREELHQLVQSRLASLRLDIAARRAELAKNRGSGEPMDIPEAAAMSDGHIRRLQAECDELLATHGAVEDILDPILTSGRPGDGRVRDKLNNLASMIAGMIPDSADAKRLARFFRAASSPALLIVDRAGGGKTNLLCHLALARSASQCIVFIHGRFPVEDQESLIREVASRLGWNRLEPLPAFLERVDRLLDQEAQIVSVFVDGINENRNIAMVSSSLDRAMACFASLRFRMVITCRDIYWRFFEGAKWVESARIVERGELYEFSEQEQEQAIPRYLSYFNLDVVLGATARTRCRHPLLLRFFCEAYTSPTSSMVHVGRVDDIRLKPLFDDYWRAKLTQTVQDVSTTPESCLLSLAREMNRSQRAAVETTAFSAVSGVSDLETERSPYIYLLDEDIILDELPTATADNRRVVFVYEEFMEYAIARDIFRARPDVTGNLDDILSQLTRAASGEFVNALGIGEYLCAFYLDSRLLRTALEIISGLLLKSPSWSSTIANVFVKYDSALDVFSLEPQYTVPSMEHLFSAIGAASRPRLVEACAVAAFRVALPYAFEPDALRSAMPSELPLSVAECLVDYAPAEGLPVIRRIGKCIEEFKVNPIRMEFWKECGAARQRLSTSTRCQLLHSLASLLRRSPHSSHVLVYAANGLLDHDPAIRACAALLTQGIEHPTVLRLRQEVLKRESSDEVRVLLSRSA